MTDNNKRNVTVGSVLGAIFSPRNCFNLGASFTRAPVSAVTEVTLRATAPVTGTALGLVAGVGMGLIGGVNNAFKPSEQRGAEMSAALADAKLTIEQARVQAAEDLLARREAFADAQVAKAEARVAKAEAKAAAAEAKATMAEAAAINVDAGVPVEPSSKTLRTQVEIAGEAMQQVPAGAAA